ncbi:hypothetical protein IAG44_05095 [Streptomyces roseirectus]|uniref:Uncharacterized protein n=1 Tax=Streptomyces roseirectus TaxID=2768066 RepID=A0A7H0I7W9_9ACTN|nr:hypothetical protein [Streptomyces roseirectus]QNP68885.1 hypothetical protein IAG44_05095 [Streptomyces roseirectus]
MTEPEFTATGVRIGSRLRSLTRAGQVRVGDGRVELLNSRGGEIDSAPARSVRVSRSWFGADARARAELNGTRYSLTLATGEPGDGGGGGEGRASGARGFVEAVRRARGG